MTAPVGSAIEEETGSFGHAIRAAAVLALMCASSRAAGQRRDESTVTRYHAPPQYQHKRLKVLRRLQPYGIIPGWTTKLMQVRRKQYLWKVRRTAPLSLWGRHMIEYQRVRMHYGQKAKQLRNYARKAYAKGQLYPTDNLVQRLESRLDNFMWRCGVGRTMYEARAFVRKGHVQYKRSFWKDRSKRSGQVIADVPEGRLREWRTCNASNLTLFPGDQVRVRPGDVSDGKTDRLRDKSIKTARYLMEKTGDVKVPSHISWDREKLQGEYCDVCHHSEVGMPINERLLHGCFSGQSPYKELNVKNVRFYPGTSKEIPKYWNGGKPRDTPENLRNMKLGLGYNRRGRYRPPCLWGRTQPLNNPYESDQTGLAPKKPWF
jgi:small subunit ribosomal protein S4